MIHQHDLLGCAPDPLAHYLKALGILRLVAEQADPEARGAWRDEHFVLWTHLDRAGLERFFLEDYRPTPLLSPWNKGSGLMSDSDPAVCALERSTAPRFSDYRSGIGQVRAFNSDLADADAAVRRIKDEVKSIKAKSERERVRETPEYKVRLADADRRFKERKTGVAPACRRTWRGTHLDWLESAVVITAEGVAKYPSLLGTGGNDGRLDMTNNAMQRLGELFDLADGAAGPRPGTAEALRDALWAQPAQTLVDAAIGQFQPGSAGGANSTNGPSGSPSINRWDFLLALEGAVAFRANASRRLSTNSPALGSAPFAVFSHAAGYGSASAADEGGRGEQWMPLWSRPTSHAEIRQLLAEGRAQTGRAAARQPVDLVRAVTRLGVARGLSSFVRYGYIERNGQSNLAVPLGRVVVGDHPRARLVDDLAPWLDRLRRRARDKNAPARLQAVERRLSNAVFEALARPDEPRRWQGVLLAAADAEALLVPGSSSIAGPIPALRPEWIAATDDGTPEHRLAAALGTARAESRRSGKALDPVRGHFLPLDERGRLAVQGAGLSPRVSHDPRVVASAAPEDVLLGLVERRIVESERGAARRLPLVAAPGLGASLSDVAAFIEGGVDASFVLRLARAFAAVDIRGPLHLRAAHGAVSEDAWLVLRIAHLGAPLADGRSVPVDPAIIRRLRSGDAAGALTLAMRRLRAAGFALPIVCGTADPTRARRWGAALAFPISPSAMKNVLKQLSPLEGDRT